MLLWHLEGNVWIEIYILENKKVKINKVNNQLTQLKNQQKCKESRRKKIIELRLEIKKTLKKLFRRLTKPEGASSEKIKQWTNSWKGFTKMIRHNFKNNKENKAINR